MIGATDLCPDDPLAEGLVAAFDAAQLRDALARARPHWRVQTARIERAKYKPYSKALLSIQAACADGAARRAALRVLPRGQAERQYLRARTRAGSAEAGVFELPGLNAVGWAFPLDYKMPGLPMLADPELFAREALPELVATLAPGAKLERWSAEIAHYAAEQSCTMRVALDLRDAGGETHTRVVYGKHHARDEAGQAHEALEHIASTGAQPFGAARIVLQQSRFDLQWQEEAPGQPLTPRLLVQDQANLLPRVAHAVAALHAVPANLRNTSDPVNLALLRRRLTIASALAPDHAARAQAAIDALDRIRPLPRSAPRLSHGDLHPKNLFDDGARITFIDFDAARMAPPEHDVASFNAALIYHGALSGLDDAEIARATACWVSAYEGAAGALDLRMLAWLTAYCLLDERLYRCLTRLKPGRRDTAVRLLNWTEEQLALVADHRRLALV